jgi:hypothetical protein
VVKEIESPEPEPSGNLIHDPGKLDGVFTGDGRFLWPSIYFTIQASWMESSPRGATITSGDYFPVDQYFGSCGSWRNQSGGKPPHSKIAFRPAAMFASGYLAKHPGVELK